VKITLEKPAKGSPEAFVNQVLGLVEVPQVGVAALALGGLGQGGVAVL